MLTNTMRMKPKKTTIYLDREVKKYLQYKAINIGCSMSALINAQFQKKKIINKHEREEKMLKKLFEEFERKG